MAATMASVVSHHPAALRNRVPIMEAVKELGIGDPGLALEIGSGTGAHIEVLAPAFPGLVWQPSEYIGASSQAQAVQAPFDESSRALETIDLCGSGQFPNVRPAVALDASRPFAEWPASVAAARGEHRLVYCSNVCHISPWAVTCGIIAGASEALAPGGSLLIYGPFKVDGRCTTESNAAFDQSLRERDPEWGIRDVDELAKQAAQRGLRLAVRKEMPANNFMLRYLKD
jgi:hypothetical protein